MLPPDRTFSVNRSGNNLITECPGTDSVLKEIEDEEASEVMKTGLFQYLVGIQIPPRDGHPCLRLMVGRYLPP